MFQIPLDRDDLIVDERIIDDLLCRLCHKRPIMAVFSTCEHLFCDECLADYRDVDANCPICATKLGENKRVPELVIRMINKIKTRCRNDGCSHVMAGLQDEITLHHWHCGYRRTRCIFPGCNEAYLEKDKNRHRDRCIGRRHGKFSVLACFFCRRAMHKGAFLPVHCWKEFKKSFPEVFRKDDVLNLSTELD